LFDFNFAPTAFTELDKTAFFAMTFSYSVFMAVKCNELCEQFTSGKSAFLHGALWAVPLLD
jgi:hypothetical protein